MFSVRKIAAQQLFQRNTYNLGFGKKRKPTPSDLEKYDVVVVGAGLGSVLATHLDAVVGQKYKLFLSYDNAQTYFTPDRNLYEQGVVAKFNFSANTRTLISKNIGQSDFVGVEKIDPANNQVTLRNGRNIQYENLVVATGQKDNSSNIAGFDDAWADVDHPFYTNADHSSWKNNCAKGYRVHYNFNGGDAFFYIPPGTHSGDIENYNFLLSKAFWDMQSKAGKLSWEKSSLTVINPNKNFTPHFQKADDFLKHACYENNINIENDLVLEEIRKEDNVAVFKHQGSGQLVERPYAHFYSLMPTVANPLLAEAGLADSTGFMDVDPNTLQHTKYSNIFGLGDCINAPTTKTFYGGLSQVAVVRHNVERNLNGLSLNAKYDGYSKANLFLNPGRIASVEHKYGGEEVSFSTDALSTMLKFKLYGSKEAENIFKFKNWGPPNYKWKKSFDSSSSSPVPAKSELEPEKKVAA